MQRLKLHIRNVALIVLNILTSVLTLIAFSVLPITKNLVIHYLKECDIKVGGNRAFDARVTDNRFYSYIVGNGFIGLTDAYVKGYFQCDNIGEFLVRILRHRKINIFCLHPSIYLRNLINRHLYSQTEASIVELGKNYDEDSFHLNDDECKDHSSGYWKHANTLHDATEEKCELVAKKLKLKRGMTVLDLGCGEGVLCKHLAKNHHVSVTGVNISLEALQKARKNCIGLDVKYELKDYRQITGKYDRITCIQLIECIGVGDLRPFFELLNKSLKDDGIVFLEFTGVNHNFFPSHSGLFEKFCNSTLTFHYYLDVLKSIDGLFIIEDWQNISPHGIRTLIELCKEMKQNWDKFLEVCDENTLRGSEVAFAYAAATMGARLSHPFHLILSKNGLKDGYDAVVDIH